MKNKQLFLANIPFLLIAAILLIVTSLDLMDSQIGSTLIVITVGCQNLFIGLRFYKEDKKSRMFHIFMGIVFFVMALWIVLKTYNII